MDQDTLVDEQKEDGRKLIRALSDQDFEVYVAFWGKPADASKWYLYLASSFLDDHGPATGYRLVHNALRQMSDLWIQPLDIKLIGVKDSLAAAVASIVQPKKTNGPFATKNPKPYPGMTWLGETTLGGLSFERVCIYPPLQPAASA